MISISPHSYIAVQHGRGLGMRLMSTNANDITVDIVSHTLCCSFKLNNLGHALATC